MGRMSHYYVYRFLDETNTVIYVGRTVDLFKRFIKHEHLSEKVKKIQYITCKSEADMLWKEIYYINYFYNDKSENVSDVGSGEITKLKLRDKWNDYDISFLRTRSAMSGQINDEQILHSQYEEYVINVPKYNYDELITIVDDNRLNYTDMYEEVYGTSGSFLSRAWFLKNKDTDDMKQLKNNITNFFRNKYGRHLSAMCGWCTYYDCKEMIQNKGYAKGFIPLDGKGKMDTSCITILAFACNPSFPCVERNTEKDDRYALTKLMEFLWQSVLAEGKPIIVYLPSRRMRDLLTKWISENKLI